MYIYIYIYIYIHTYEHRYAEVSVTVLSPKTTVFSEHGRAKASASERETTA